MRYSLVGTQSATLLTELEQSEADEAARAEEVLKHQLQQIEEQVKRQAEARRAFEQRARAGLNERNRASANQSPCYGFWTVDLIISYSPLPSTSLSTYYYYSTLAGSFIYYSLCSTACSQASMCVLPFLCLCMPADPCINLSIFILGSLDFIVLF